MATRCFLYASYPGSQASSRNFSRNVAKPSLMDFDSLADAESFQRSPFGLVLELVIEIADDESIGAAAEDKRDACRCQKRHGEIARRRDQQSRDERCE